MVASRDFDFIDNQVDLSDVFFENQCLGQLLVVVQRNIPSDCQDAVSESTCNVPDSQVIVALK